jgi:hypothetical protein
MGTTPFIQLISKTKNRQTITKRLLILLETVYHSVTRTLAHLEITIHITIHSNLQVVKEISALGFKVTMDMRSPILVQLTSDNIAITNHRRDYTKNVLARQATARYRIDKVLRGTTTTRTHTLHVNESTTK